jgi:hypothetical protein
MSSLSQKQKQFAELSKALNGFVEILRDFDQGKKEETLLKQEIVVPLRQIDVLGKSIGGQIHHHVQKLKEDFSLFIQEPKDIQKTLLMQDCVRLKNEVWEL